MSPTALLSSLVVAAGVFVSGCGSPPQYVPKDSGTDSKGDAPLGTGGTGGSGAGGHLAGSGGVIGAGTGGANGAGSGGATVITGAGGVVGEGTGGSILPGSGGVGQGGKAGATHVGTGGVNSGGAGGIRTASGGAGPATGGTTPPGTGGTVGSGGTSPPGTGGSTGCSGTQKMCNGTCIASNECCPTCSGNKPVCMNGTTCVGKSNGTTCAMGAECSSTNCVDGVCCDTSCTGNCESCSLGTKGTCSPSTTPRAACTGTGACAGKCDGTAAHRAACTFPGNTTSCGAPASCTGGTATTAALCDGAGACVASTMMSCMFGCRTDSMPLCADMCPTNQALCSGTTCVDTSMTAAHCGSTCSQCRNSTPDCVQGKCVQCNSNAECTDTAHASLNLGAYAICNTSTHSCACAKKDAGNVLTNPGFDTDLSGWHAASDGSTIAFSFSDGFFCGSSGSASFDNGFGGIQQCARITGGSSYFLGAMYYQSSGGSPVSCSVEYHANSSCTDSALGFDVVSGSTGSQWALMHKGVLAAPSNATYALVACAQFEGGAAQVDQVYLNSVTDGF